uniref:F-box domain-containing protein n=1 Tax=Megaselia scalaris TaxID=36166 RepID=T1GMM5_MEGSC
MESQITNSQKCLGDLPVEILIKVFEYQPSVTELQKISMVCKKWRNIVDEHLNYLEKAFLISSYMCSKGKPVMPLTRNYKCLSLVGKDLQTVMPLIEPLKIKHLKAEGLPFSKVTELLEKYKDTLEVLEFKNLSQDFGSFCELKNLTTLKVTAYDTDDIEFLEMLLELNSKSITALEFNILCGIDVDLHFVRNLSNLKSFKINAQNDLQIYFRYQGTSNFTFAIRDAIRQLPSLEELILCEIPELHLDIIDRDPLRSQRKQNGTFKEDTVLNREIPFLTKFQCIDVHSNSFSSPVFKPHLKELSLTINRLDLDFSKLMKNCPFVEKFRLESEQKINVNFLNQISKGWPKLKEFVLRVENMDLDTESSPIVFPKLISLKILCGNNLNKIFRLIRTPKLLELDLLDSTFEEGVHEFYCHPYNRKMLENLRSITSVSTCIPGFFPHATHISMKIDAEKVVPLIKRFESKSLSCSLDLFDSRKYTCPYETKSSAIKFLNKLRDDLSMDIYDFFPGEDSISENGRGVTS